MSGLDTQLAIPVQTVLDIRPMMNDQGRDELEWFGHQVYMNLSQAQARRAMILYTGMQSRDIWFHIGAMACEAIVEMEKLESAPGRTEKAQARIDKFMRGWNDLLSAHYYRLWAAYDQNAVGLANQVMRYEPKKVIEVTPVEKREGLFRRIGRFLFGD